MARLADIAEVKIRGGDVPEPGSRDEEIILSAWRMYRYVSAIAMRTGREMLHLNSDGHTWEGDLEVVAHSLWPAGTPPVNGDDWMTGYQTVRNWLLLNKNMDATNIGRPETRSRREGVIALRLPHWWIRDKFAGAPPGMKLPDLDDSGRPAAPARQPTARPPAAVRTEEAPDWWCTFISTCTSIGPYTQQGLREHVIRHGFKPGNGMFSRIMEDAAALREDRNSDPSTAPPPPPPPPPPPLSPPLPVEDDQPARSILDMVSEKRESAPPPVQPSARTGGIAVQARVYADQVAELESEVIALRRRNAELEAEIQHVRAAQREVRLGQQDIDAIAHRTAALLSSENGTAR